MNNQYEVAFLLKDSISQSERPTTMKVIASTESDARQAVYLRHNIWATKLEVNRK